MNQNIRDRLSVRSPRSRRIAKIFFVAMVIVYLVLISYSYCGRLDSSRDVMRLGALWCLGAVAVALVVRSRWKERKQ
jgi:quinol-cytochrome oxidoreductase complex cytochrome b subunit